MAASLEEWRNYFLKANSDIFTVIEQAIMVAAFDCPFDFKLKRDRIAEVLFSSKITKCDKLELSVPTNDDDKIIDIGTETGAGGSKESKVNSFNRDDDDDDDEIIDIEALDDDEILQQESQLYGDVLRIKQLLDNHQHESSALLIDSLKRLQLMSFSIETLKVTEIGKSVNALRKHGAKEIRNLVRTLIKNWMIMVDSYVETKEAVAAGTEIQTDSVQMFVVEEEKEEGLPSPPLDEGAFLADPTSMELSQFFDGIDDDGSEFNKNRENGGNKPNVKKTEARKLENESLKNSHLPLKPEQKRNLGPVLKKQTPLKPNGPLSGERVRPVVPKPSNYESGPKVQQKPDKAAFPKKPMPPRQEKLNFNNESCDGIRLEAAKRKLHERYQEVQNGYQEATNGTNSGAARSSKAECRAEESENEARKP
ncbi:hypothetical protein CASFOL_025566 [Castilleja foliolosa]|uniref:TFIIS N-terminal domain-containing protein n=1 Tax=Castilleja foliolosa TaxID=1961234 RepID=A0ABD3CVI4_9LAMI